MAGMSITQRIARVKGAMACENVMAKHVFYHSGGMHREEMEEIWSKGSDTTMTNSKGTLVGWEKLFENYVVKAEELAHQLQREISEIYPDVMDAPDYRTIPGYANHYTTSPVLEVAEDGQTAKGFFYTPGFVANWVTSDGKVHETSVHGRFGVDYVLEDGKWVIKHFRFCPDITGSVMGRGFAPGFDAKTAEIPGEFESEDYVPAEEAFCAWSPIQMPQSVPQCP